MKRSDIVTAVLIYGILVCFIYFQFIDKKAPENNLDKFKSAYNTFSIEKGNQTEMIIAPAYGRDSVVAIKKRYSNTPDLAYEDREMRYEALFIDTLSSFSIAQKNPDDELFRKLTRGQKVLWLMQTFTFEVQNGGVYQFLYNHPELSAAALESFKELKQDSLVFYYQKCLNEMADGQDAYAKRKDIVDDPNTDQQTKSKSFAEGYEDIKSGDLFDNYFYDRETGKRLNKALADYMDDHIDQFVKK